MNQHKGDLCLNDGMQSLSQNDEASSDTNSFSMNHKGCYDPPSISLCVSFHIKQVSLSRISLNL